jgi:DNA-binding response OmpR family regulator
MIVLVVEDEPITSFVLASELERAGHVVLGPAANASDALQLAEGCRPDVAILEIGIDGKCAGVELAHQLTRMNVPCLYSSAFSTLARSHSEWALGYLAKPYNSENIAAIFAVIEDVMAGVFPRPTELPPALELFTR